MMSDVFFLPSATLYNDMKTSSGQTDECVRVFTNNCLEERMKLLVPARASRDPSGPNYYISAPDVFQINS